MKYPALTVLFSIFFFAPAPANACCFCIIPEFPEALERANAVFVGEVVDIVEPASSDSNAPLTDRLYTIKFRISKTFKGATFAERTVLSGQGKGCFAYPAVSKGQRYLVYGEKFDEDDSRTKGLLVIHSCSRTALLPLPGLRKPSQFSDYEYSDGYEDLKLLEERSPRRSPNRPF